MSNPHEFDKDELKNISWWSSRHPVGTDRDEGIKRSRRLVLLDILILAIFAGVLIPWVMPALRSRSLGVYSIQLKRQSIDGIIAYTVRLSHTDEADAGGTVNQIGIAIMDESGKVIYTSEDIPPARGEKREFVYLDTENRAESLRVFADSEAIVIRI
ncbi:MAG: hypothetical protein B6D68_02430 [spirochete symbiont of Stewartia floridana]|nr:MAG: hypothetical protein B6D68_02430 [spirochete symbiont of Stewartia floridana]